MSYVERREAILAYITDYYAKHGAAPTAREIAEATGANLSSVHLHQRRLVEAGRLRHHRTKYLPVQNGEPAPELIAPSWSLPCPYLGPAHDFADVGVCVLCRKCGAKR